MHGHMNVKHEKSLRVVGINRQWSPRPSGYQAAVKNQWTEIRGPCIISQWQYAKVNAIQLNSHTVHVFQL
jgi:hypothetical protein